MANRNLLYLKTILTNTLTAQQREKSVVMFHIGRSGSTVLGDLFNQNDQIFWDSEIFMLKRLTSAAKPLSRLVYSFPSLVMQTRRMRTTKPIYGCEIKFAHVERLGMSVPQFVNAVEQINFKYFITLRRRNQLRVIISHLVANQQGYWHQTAQGTGNGAGKGPAPVQVKINVDAVPMGLSAQRSRLPLLDHLQATDEEFNRLNVLLAEHSLLNLVYEDDIEHDPTQAYRKVCAFLNVTPTPVQVIRKRTNPKPTQELLSNYDEVADALAGSPYEWMLT